MWYASHVDVKELDLWTSSTEAAVQFARTVRETHRKRTSKSDLARERDIEAAQARLRRVMQPIRSELARISKQIDADPSAYELPQQRAKLHELSDALQRERRKLWKMTKREKRRGKSRRRR